MPGTTRDGGATRSERTPVVADVMTRDVVALAPESTVREAAEFFAAHGISGAPVVGSDRILGVLSLTDIVEFDAVTPGVPTAGDDREWDDMEPPDEGEEPDDPSAFYVEMWSDAGADVTERFSAVDGPEWDVLEEHSVAEIMTRDLLTVAPAAPIADAARMMLRHGVHRLLVVEDAHLHGVVTTMDLLRGFVGGDGE